MIRAKKMAILGCFFLLLSASNGFGMLASITGPDVRSGDAVKVDLEKAPKATVLVFLSATCPCSASHEPALRKLHSEFASKGYAFYGIHSNADEEEAITREHFKAADLPFPVLADRGARIADAYGALKTPHVFVVDPKGAIVFQGGVDDSHLANEAKKPYLKEALLALDRGERPPQAQVRAIGCVIKR